MAIVSNISVGDVMYYQVDEIPTHVAPKGSVAIMTSGITYANGFTYVNNDGNTTWLKCISPSHGNFSYNEITNEYDFDSFAVGSFYPMGINDSNPPTPDATLTWVLDTGSTTDWVLTQQELSMDYLTYIYVSIFNI
jgi:hypothetical protein